jgi:hypothetical protein
MKIDKIIFSTSESFSIFWNMNAKVWKTKFGIEPVCLLFGKKENTDMSEEYGQVIEMPIMEEWPLLIQITWSKFFHPTTEPDKTWLIGDIDQLPLSKHWFTTNIESVPDDHYVHLDADGITQLNGTKYTWCGRELNRQSCRDLGCPTNMPGHYHCARGDVMKTGLEITRCWRDEIIEIVTSGRYNNSRAYRECDPIEQHNLWCAEELRSTKALRNQICNHGLKYSPFHLAHGIGRIDGDRLDKCQYDQDKGEYVCDLERLTTGKYVDLHCVRPFAHYLPEVECQRRLKATENALRLAKMLD